MLNVSHCGWSGLRWGNSHEKPGHGEWGWGGRSHQLGRRGEEGMSQKTPKSCDESFVVFLQQTLSTDYILGT